MANWTRIANGSTAGNISMNVDIGIASVTRTSNTNVRVVYGVRFTMATGTWTSNSVKAFCPKNGSGYFAFNSGSGSSHTSSGTWYYAYTDGKTHTSEACPFTIDIPVTITQTSASFEVGYGWDGWNPSQCGSSSVTVTFPTGATVPTGLSCSIVSKTETTVTLTGGHTSDGGASVTGLGYQYSTDGSTWYPFSNANTPLNPNTTYYFRYYATNSQGTAYSGNVYTTTYAYPYLTSIPEFTVGNSLTISIYNPLGRSCTVSVIGDNGAEYIGGTITGTTVYPFNNDSWKNVWYSTLPNKTSGKYKARLVCATGNVNQLSGQVNYYLNTNDIGFKPTFTDNDIINIVNTANTDIAGTNKFIKNHNSLSGVIKPMTAQRSASGNYYNISTSGLATVRKNYSSSNINFVLGNMNSNTFNVTAVDSRGFSTTVSKNIDLIDYNNPRVTSSHIVRQNGIGTKAILHFVGAYTNWSGLLQTNTIQSIKYKIGSSGTWKNLPNDAILTISNGVWTLDTILTDDFVVTSQYDLYLQITDLLETVTVGAYTISTADAFVWKDLANKRIGINKKPDDTLDINGTTHSTNFKIGENNNGPWHLHRKTIDLSGSTYNTDTYYPVVANTGIPVGCMHRIGTSVGLNTNKPSWSTHTYGFSLNIEVLEEAWGWGVTNQLGIILADDYKFANGKPGWYKQLGHSSRPCFYLRGGGKYYLYTDYLTEWTIYTESTTISEQTVAPTTNVGETVLLTPSYKTGLLAYPIGSVYISNSNTNPGTIFGGTWVCDRATAGGELLAFGLANTTEVGSAQMYPNIYYSFSDLQMGNAKHYTVRNYVDGILTGQAGALYVRTKGIVGMIDATMCISGLSSTNNQGFWFGKNGNDLPTGVYVMPNDTKNGCLVGGAATSNGYGGASMNYLYDVNTNDDVGFYVNPTASPYGGNFTASSGGVSCWLIVKVYAKPGYYVWRRTG